MTTRDWNAAVEHLERRQKDAAMGIWGANDAVTDAVLAVELDGAPPKQLEAARAHLALLQNQQRELAAALVVAQDERGKQQSAAADEQQARQREIAAANEARGWDPAEFIKALRNFGMSGGGVPGSMSPEALRLSILFGRYVDEPARRDAQARAAQGRLQSILSQMNTGSEANARAAITRLCDELERGTLTVAPRPVRTVTRTVGADYDPVPA